MSTFSSVVFFARLFLRISDFIFVFFNFKRQNYIFNWPRISTRRFFRLVPNSTRFEGAHFSSFRLAPAGQLLKRGFSRTLPSFIIFTDKKDQFLTPCRQQKSRRKNCLGLVFNPERIRFVSRIILNLILLNLYL